MPGFASSGYSSGSGMPVDGIVTRRESNETGNGLAAGAQQPLTLTPTGDLRVRTVFEPHVTDAFDRLRVANSTVSFEGKSLYFDRLLEFVEKTTGAATSSHGTYAPIKTLSVPDGVTGSATRQARWYANYQAGKSQQVLMTFDMTLPITGATQRVGYFDNLDGIFLENTVTGTFLVVRNSSLTGVADDSNRVERASWNIDPMDGTGPSGRILDLTKSQILAMDFEWLGVGNVRIGFVMGGKLYYVHQFTHANEQSGVYMSTPSLPPRWEVNKTATSGAVGIDAICCSVNSEGGSTLNGWSTAVDRAVSTFSYTSAYATTLRPLLSIRTRTSSSKMTAFPETVEVICSTTSTRGFRWAVILNPQISGGTAASWVSASNNSGIEYDISSSGQVIGGFPVASGYGIGNSLSALQRTIQPLGLAVDGTRDIYVLAIQQIAASGGTPEEYVASMSWREVF